MTQRYRIKCLWYDGQQTYTRSVATKAEAKALARTLGDLGMIVAVEICPFIDRRG